jgi:hypothetical protein
MSRIPLCPDQASFLSWMSQMEMAIAKLFVLVGPEVASRLNYEVESLHALEAWLLQSYSDYRDLLSKENAPVYDGAARYFGEVLRRAVGGEWIVFLNSKRSSSFGYPAIDNYPGRGVLITPHTCITAAIDRQKGHYLLSIVKNAQEDVKNAQEDTK